MEVVIGCPVSKRAWILPMWKQYVDEMLADRWRDHRFVFVMAPDDEECIDIAKGWDRTDVIISDESPREDKRDWTVSRYHQMVKVRNELLDAVRGYKPEYFLSLDCDILPYSGLLTDLTKVVNDYPESVWAVGGKTFMTPQGEDYPSYGDWRDPLQHSAGFRRRQCDDLRRVGIIMGIKLMTSRAYNVDYEFHTHGEDIGWSSAVANMGGKLMWDGRKASKHVLSESMLIKTDERVGF